MAVKVAALRCSDLQCSASQLSEHVTGSIYIVASVCGGEINFMRSKCGVDLVGPIVSDEVDLPSRAVVGLSAS